MLLNDALLLNTLVNCCCCCWLLKVFLESKILSVLVLEVVVALRNRCCCCCCCCIRLLSLAWFFLCFLVNLTPPLLQLLNELKLFKNCPLFELFDWSIASELTLPSCELTCLSNLTSNGTSLRLLLNLFCKTFASVPLGVNSLLPFLPFLFGLNDESWLLLDVFDDLVVVVDEDDDDDDLERDVDDDELRLFFLRFSFFEGDSLSTCVWGVIGPLIFFS